MVTSKGEGTILDPQDTVTNLDKSPASAQLPGLHQDSVLITKTREGLGDGQLLLARPLHLQLPHGELTSSQ